MVRSHGEKDGERKRESKVADSASVWFSFCPLVFLSFYPSSSPLSLSVSGHIYIYICMDGERERKGERETNESTRRETRVRGGSDRSFTRAARVKTCRYLVRAPCLCYFAPHVCRPVTCKYMCNIITYMREGRYIKLYRVFRANWPQHLCNLIIELKISRLVSQVVLRVSSWVKIYTYLINLIKDTYLFNTKRTEA